MVFDAERRACASFPRFMLYEADRGDWADALEQGRIVHFANCPIVLPAPEDQNFLRDGLSPFLRRKNVSYYPGAEKLTGIQAPASVHDRARTILREHWLQVRQFLERAMPAFTRGWTAGTSSFRPMEERGRGLTAHASNELIHVDAGAYGATHGDRILRFFVNLNPSRDRVWISKGTFEELFRRYGGDAGVSPGPLDAALPERILSGLLNGAGKAFPMARVIDSSPYDRRMRRFHNWMKDTPSFQEPPHQRFSFAPGSAWMVLTDGVSHACIEGQHALVDTFLVPLRNCRRPAPYHLLAGAA
jgi:3-deoxy-D-manno-oct-2-ulosonic acid (Kdo) hydroxylase